MLGSLKEPNKFILVNLFLSFLKQQIINGFVTCCDLMVKVFVLLAQCLGLGSLFTEAKKMLLLATCY